MMMAPEISLNSSSHHKKKGFCPDCGVQTHCVSSFKMIPLTNDLVHVGTCIKCNPTSVPPNVWMKFEYRNDAADLPTKRISAPQNRLKAPFPDRRLSEKKTLVCRPATLRLKGCWLDDANGSYERDKTYHGPYNRYIKEGMHEGEPVTYTFHRSSNRWFLSAFHPDRERVFLFSASFGLDYSESPPTTPSAWANMDGTAEPKMRLVVCKFENVSLLPRHYVSY
jgi:hypothetical protein